MPIALHNDQMVIFSHSSNSFCTTTKWSFSEREGSIRQGVSCWLWQKKATVHHCSQTAKPLALNNVKWFLMRRIAKTAFSVVTTRIDEAHFRYGWNGMAMDSWRFCRKLKRGPTISTQVLNQVLWWHSESHLMLICITFQHLLWTMTTNCSMPTHESQQNSKITYANRPWIC